MTVRPTATCINEDLTPHAGVSVGSGGRSAAAVSIITLLIVTLMACTCSRRETEDPEAPLIPLTVGNRWVYEVYRDGKTGGGRLRQDDRPLELRETRKLDGEEYFVTTSDLAFRLTPDGLSFARYEKDAFDDLEILLRYPIESGTDYEYTSTKVRQPDLTVRVVKEAVTTPAGTYEAYTYRVFIKGSGMFLVLSFAPGTGMVKMENAYGATWLLSSFEAVAGTGD